MATKIIFSKNGKTTEHSMGFKCSRHYALDWFRRNILESQGEMSLDDRRSLDIKLIEVIGAK